MTAVNGGIETSRGVNLEFDDQPFTPSRERIRQLSDIPCVQTMDVRPAEHLVMGMIPRESVISVSGPPGSAKTGLMMRLCISVASGTEFLGRRCSKCPVLILDYENALHEIRCRLDSMTAETPSRTCIFGESGMNSNRQK